MPKGALMGRIRPSTADDRRFERHRQRFPCTIQSADANHRGFVADASASGLFINTSAVLEPGTQTTLKIEPLGAPEIILSAVVVRQKRSHRSASVVLPPGLGFSIETAPEAYYQLVMGFDETVDTDEPTQ